MKVYFAMYQALVSAGVHEDRVKNVVEALEGDMSHLATKHDLSLTKTELMAEMKDVRSEIKLLRSDMKILMWGMGLIIASVLMLRTS